ESGIVKLLRHRLEDSDEIPSGCLDFPTLVSDGVKSGGLTGLVIAQVSGRMVPSRRLSVDRIPIQGLVYDQVTGGFYDGTTGYNEQLVMQEGLVWRLVVELIPFEDYYTDPTGRGLYEIVEQCTDLYQIVDQSQGDSPDYDPEAVARLSDSYSTYTD